MDESKAASEELSSSRSISAGATEEKVTWTRTETGKEAGTVEQGTASEGGQKILAISERCVREGGGRGVTEEEFRGWSYPTAKRTLSCQICVRGDQST